MADLLFVHTNFPAQFGFVAQAMAARGHACRAISSETGREVAGVPLTRWGTKRGSTPGIFAPATRAEADLIRGAASARAALALKEGGFTPDVIVGHPGWGETVFLREVFPKARQVAYAEFYYRAEGADVGFDPEFGTPTLEERFRIHAKNATMATAYAEADRIVSPTRFQASLLPAAFRDRAAIIHEGVDLERVRPDPGACLDLGGRVLDRSVPVVTFINRRFEPLRGYHVFMRALPRLLEAVPDAEVVLIGSDAGAGYGLAAPQGSTWRQRFLDEVKDRIDLSRVHFAGHLPHDRMLAALSVSRAHVYFTYPFVLSWSLLEAMASECLIVASDTAPVRDAIRPGQNGLLLDFFDHGALAQTLIEACRDPDSFAPLRKAARETVVADFNRTRCREAWIALIEELCPPV
ncbi:MAG TPA: glycosyltransferase [Beijerinckiaceae bacterium]|jgi:glycosyltransferase involved in cell wall biosynthesis